MTAFEIFLYALAILTVLLLRAEPAPQVKAIAPQPVEDDLPSLEELLVEAEQLTARPVPTVAAKVSAPVAIAVIKLTPDRSKMTVAQLREECDRQSIPWENTRGKGKHMLKGVMIEKLG